MVPKLRFSQFHSSWCAKKLGDVGEIISGLTYSPENIRNSGLLVLRSSNIQSGKLCFEDCVYVDLIVDDEKKTRENDILICVRNGSRSLIGKNTLIKELNQETTHGAFMTVFRGPLNSYVAQLLQTKNFYSQVYSDLGATINSINGGNLKRYSFSFPSDFNEIAKIADFLSSVDDKIMLLNKQYEQLCHYKKGMMQKIFNQKLRFKDDSGDEFPEWEPKQLSDIAMINPKNKELPSEFIYIDLESVEKGQLLKEQLILKKDAPSRAQRLLLPGDVLFQLVRPYQNNNYIFFLRGNYVASTGYAQLRANYNPQFLYQLLQLESFTSEVMNRCTGTSYPAINSSDLASIEIEIPSEKEQIKIASFLSTIDAKIAVKKAELDKLKTWKQGLLQQMFI